MSTVCISTFVKNQNMFFQVKHIMKMNPNGTYCQLSKQFLFKNRIQIAPLSTSAKNYSENHSSKKDVHTSSRLSQTELETVKKQHNTSLTPVNHFKSKTHEYSLPHPIWTDEEADSVLITHRKPKGISDKLAYICVQTMRKSFDLFSGFTVGKHLKTIDERCVLNRIIFLETVAGVPGFSAAMIRHLNSLRRMKSDHGWIHTLLEEAENERMHLLTFTELRRPGFFFRGMVIFTQWLFTGGFSLAYLMSPNFCHRFVGYLEEEAVSTYTYIIDELDHGRLPMFKVLPAPQIAIDYWKLGNDAMIRDVLLAVRADEAHHRDVNHVLGSMKLNEKNPFPPGY